MAPGAFPASHRRVGRRRAGAFALSALLLLLLVAPSPAPASAASVGEAEAAPESAPPSDGEVICAAPGDCYPRVFEASSEFRDVRENQVVPPGLFVQINLSSGVKRAKLDGDVVSKGESSLAVVLEEEGSYKSPSGVPPGPVLPQPEEALAAAAASAAAAAAAEYAKASRAPDSDTAETVRYSAEDHGKFDSLVQEVLDFETTGDDYDRTAEALAKVLEDLADVVPERVLGLKLAEGPGLAAVAEKLDHPHWRVRKTSALVIGSAAQNNPPVQNAALKMNLAYRLLRALEAEDVPQVSREQIYALSALMRGNHAARMFFLDAVRGLEIMADVWRKNPERGVVRKKLAVFVTDLLDASMDPDAAPSPAESSTGPKFHKAAAAAAPALGFQSPDRDEVQAVNPGLSDPALRDRDVADWCALLSRDLVSGGEHLDADAREKLVLAVQMLLRSSAAACPADPPLREWLLSEHARFASDGDFDEYAALALGVAEVLALRGAAPLSS